MGQSRQELIACDCEIPVRARGWQPNRIHHGSELWPIRSLHGHLCKSCCFVFFLSAQHEGSEFPDLGLNRHPLHCKGKYYSLDHQASRCKFFHTQEKVSFRNISSHVQRSATPWTLACYAPLSMGFSWQEYWTGLPCPSPGDLPDPGIKPVSLTFLVLVGGFFTTSTAWEAGG